MPQATQEISIKGKMVSLPAFHLGEVVVVTRGRLFRIAEIFDEYWLPSDSLPDPYLVLQELRSAAFQPDLFTFAQRAPEVQPRYAFKMEWDNVAVIPISSYDVWLKEQISSASRRNIRTSEKKGVIVKEKQYDDDYVRGIMSIYNESPIRAGRQFWHYNKNFGQVQTENGTYRERSTFLAAYDESGMIGYMKIVWDRHTAAIMQVLSKLKARDKRPNNALLSEAVKLCVRNKVSYLLYERYVYGSNTESTLTRFKRENGFIRMDLPRYYVPLTPKGKLFYRLGLHRTPRDRMPHWLRSRLIRIREGMRARRAGAIVV